MTVNIEVLVVPDCPNDAKAITSARTALAHEHLAAHITRTVITTDQQARERNFTGSPTILINGTDPFARPGQPIGLTCRLYPTADGPQGVPPLPDLRHALRNSPHDPGMPARHTPDSPSEVDPRTTQRPDPPDTQLPHPRENPTPHRHN
ncbi:MAG: hypothetical protein NTW76_21665 [Corynebacteriales bacterium]|nr:hypothetical protein [Mycobacteriales bacterium]